MFKFVVVEEDVAELVGISIFGEVQRGLILAAWAQTVLAGRAAAIVEVSR